MTRAGAGLIDVAALRTGVTRARLDPLVRNSFFLMTTTAMTALLGFVFWLVVARLYPVHEVGQATSLLSALALLSYFSLVGMSSSLVRRLPTSTQRSEHVSTAFLVVAGVSVLVALIFAVVAGVTTPELAFVTASWANLGTFVALAVGAALNLLAASVFVALRSAKYNLLVNGVLMSLAKIVLPFLLIWAGAIGIFAASGLASCLAVLVSLWLIRNRLRIPLRLAISFPIIRDTIRFCIGTYLQGSLNLVPLLVIPILVLEQLGPEVAAAYFMAFQIATVVNSISFAVGESMFAEGAHEQEPLRALAKRSAAIMASVTVPAVLGVVVLAGPALRMFGEAYADAAETALIVLAVSSFAVAFHAWSSFLLKITAQVTAMIVSEVVFAVATTVLVVLAVGGGAAWVAAAWGGGNLLAGVVAAIALVTRVYRTRGSIIANRPAGRGAL
jgi:O-antigen/teichoic acid export membrane protein